jgi:hypothetical protein
MIEVRCDLIFQAPLLTSVTQQVWPWMMAYSCTTVLAWSTATTATSSSSHLDTMPPTPNLRWLSNGPPSWSISSSRTRCRHENPLNGEVPVDFTKDVRKQERSIIAAREHLSALFAFFGNITTLLLSNTRQLSEIPWKILPLTCMDRLFEHSSHCERHSSQATATMRCSVWVKLSERPISASRITGSCFNSCLHWEGLSENC